MIEQSLKAVRNKNGVKFDVQCPVAAEHWLEESPSSPDIAQFIHVPYDDESEEMVYRVATELVSRRSFVLIAAEHPESDLSLIRRKMFSLGYGNLPSERTTSLARRFREANLLVKTYVLGKKYLDVGRIDQIAEVDWFWDLIFGNKHPASQDKRELTSVVEKVGGGGYISTLKTTLLNVPDLFITVRQRV